MTPTRRDDPEPDGGSPVNTPAERPKGEEIEELNRATQPKAPDGRPVDPHQEQDPDTAG